MRLINDEALVVASLVYFSVKLIKDKKLGTIEITCLILSIIAAIMLALWRFRL